ncbi:class I SAM-dependent DNA methyltransferase [bacterium]|nr:class I SAM-dependent DNA methyltransferase [bacterium]
MTATEFRLKWTGHELKERSAAQEHFLDLCHLIGHKTPAEADPAGEWFCFEKGAEKLGGGDGWADVWKKGCFGWEYKGPKADLATAYRQLQQYRDSLENPPLLVVCDTDIIEVHTNFTGTVSRVHTVTLADIESRDGLQLLRNVFTNPQALHPGTTLERATEDAAGRIGELAERLRDRGVDAHDAAHFLMKLVFCLFAEDVTLLPHGLMTRLLDATRDRPDDFDAAVGDLFRAMRTGGLVAFERIEHFNGGLFDDEATIRLEGSELQALARLAKLDWSQIEPAVFGTLFERSLDLRKRAQLGAHYTSRHDIEDIIQPVLMEPLRREWAEVKAEGDTLAAHRDARKAGSASSKKLAKLVRDFMHRLTQVRVLDPACGSGNFLYVALTSLKDLELEVIRAAWEWGAVPPFPDVDPAQLFGLEIDAYAAELAQLTVWIGYLQWLHFNGFTKDERPILKPLHNIVEQDAILQVNEDGTVTEPQWPEADVIVGNPPFLGGKRLRSELHDEYVESMFRLYEGRVPHEADLCCYWFERARSEIERKRAGRAGLLATNSIRHGRNRAVLDRVKSSGGIFVAWSDRDWVLDGAQVRVSIVGFDDGGQQTRVLDGQPVSTVNPNLTAGLDFTRAQTLSANAGLSFMGDTKGGAFDIPGDLAGEMLAAPNPLGRSNADVIRPWVNGLDITRKPRDMWIVDFGVDMPEREAALYEVPYEYVRQHVLPVRATNRRASYREKWWIHVEPRPAMRKALAPLSRYLGTPILGRQRPFVWLPSEVLADHQLIVFARDDDYFFGVLHSVVHRLWIPAVSSWMGVGNDPRYTPSTCFETFPFPVPTDARREAIAAAARALHETRQSALDNDPKLTLTALYNKRPTWLQHLHEDLDRAVLEAYGWPADLSDDDLLERLLALNLERAEGERQGVIVRP